jgi:hypothetical protein
MNSPLQRTNLWWMADAEDGTEFYVPHTENTVGQSRKVSIRNYGVAHTPEDKSP